MLETNLWKISIFIKHKLDNDKAFNIKKDNF